MRHARLFGVTGLALAGLMWMPAVVVAQGTVGGQGFGYPVSQQSARAAGTAGALAPFDEVSPVNPATLALWPRPVLFMQFEPEYRSTSADGGEASTRLARFPLSGGAARIGRRGAVGISVSTYLDRTWETAAATREAIGGREVDFTTRFSSDGAINDLRAAFAWSFSGELRAGVAYHAYTGGNRMRIVWDFPDLEPFGDVDQSTDFSYSGSAYSAGVDFRTGDVGVAGYYRAGGDARVRANDTLVTEGNMPNHLGLAARYDGFRGSVVSAGWERVEWSRMQSLGSPDLRVRDGDRIALGLETIGPRIGNRATALRLGFSSRTLPFDAANSEATERLFSLGLGYVFGDSRGTANFAIQRAQREAGPARERAWLFALGFTLSP